MTKEEIAYEIEEYIFKDKSFEEIAIHLHKKFNQQTKELTEEVERWKKLNYSECKMNGELLTETIKLKAEAKEKDERIQADIRNKLSPMKNLCFMLKTNMNDEDVKDIIVGEIKQCEKSVEYLQDFLLNQ